MPKSHNVWQQKQTDKAQADIEKVFFSHINTLSDELQTLILKSKDLESMSKREIDTLIKGLLAVQNKRYEQAVGLYNRMLEYYCNYIGLTEAIGLGIEPSEGLFQRLVDRPITASGMPLYEHMANLVAYNNKKLDNTVRNAWALKQTPQELSERVTGTAVALYKNGLIYDQKLKSRSAMDAGLQHTMHHAKAETWKDNDVEKYRLMAVLDHNTTPFCQSIDGFVYAWGEKGSKTPPFHYYCRTVTIPELTEEYKWLSEGRTRWSPYGKVDANMTYAEWVKQNPKPDDWKPNERPERRKQPKDPEPPKQQIEY